MSDVMGWFKRQQEIARQKQELTRIGFAPQMGNPLLVNYRHGADGGIEMTVIADEKFRVKPMTNKQVASLIHLLTGLLASEIDK